MKRIKIEITEHQATMFLNYLERDFISKYNRYKSLDEDIGNHASEDDLIWALEEIKSQSDNICLKLKLKTKDLVPVAKLYNKNREKYLAS